jgi:hypothetical protein
MPGLPSCRPAPSRPKAHVRPRRGSDLLAPLGRRGAAREPGAGNVETLGLSAGDIRTLKVRTGHVGMLVELRAGSLIMLDGPWAARARGRHAMHLAARPARCVYQAES